MSAGEISNESRSNAVGNDPAYIVNGDPGRTGGGTYTSPNDARRDPTVQDYENIFGPAGRDVKLDLQRQKRHSRWHLPDALKGANPWLADKIDGLITDTSGSPFTTKILPYLYIENVDQKIKWNRWSFDEGLASRVPYESAARTLTQSKTSYAGYTVRQGLAITMEHNFMVSEKGRENFKNQLQQVVGSIQYTNDIDVHIALITAPSFAKERAEKYYTNNKTNHQTIREYIDLFGFMQKNPNAMDIMIEEGKSVLRSWGADEPDFLLTNSKLTFQMQMTPEKTSYLTQGPEGVKRLRTGPDINSYRGLSIINSRSFSLEDGAPPRDVLRRRVRVAEYYRIQYCASAKLRSYSLYDESKDAWQQFTWQELFNMSTYHETEEGDAPGDDDDDDAGKRKKKFITTKLPYTCDRERFNHKIPFDIFENIINDGNLKTVDNWDFVDYMFEIGSEQFPRLVEHLKPPWEMNFDVHNPTDRTQWHMENDVEKLFVTDLKNYLTGNRLKMDYRKVLFFDSYDWYNHFTSVLSTFFHNVSFGTCETVKDDNWELVIVRPCIEHYMLGIILGRGGVEQLGATLWGQTELSVYDDSMHGIWGMSYKYNERAIVFNHKNLIRMWDVAYSGYNGGKDCTSVCWTDDDAVASFKDQVYDLNRSYEGPSMMVMRFKNIGVTDPWPSPIVFHDTLSSKNEGVSFMDGEHQHKIKNNAFRVFNRAEYVKQYREYFHMMPDFSRIHNPKNAGTSSEENETSCNCLAFQGTMKVHNDTGGLLTEITGNGHHGPDHVGIASVRSGKGIAMGSLAAGVLTKMF